MHAGWMFLRTELRRRWRSWLALALIVGAFAGAVEAAAAGARRTDAAYPALLAWSNTPDLLAASGPDHSIFGDIPQSALARLPQTIGYAPLAEYSVVQPSDIALLAPENRMIPGAYWRRKILAGRLPDPRRAGEVNISFTSPGRGRRPCRSAARSPVRSSGWPRSPRRSSFPPASGICLLPRASTG